MKFIREMILFIKFCQKEFSYEKPRFYGIKNKCCTDENIFFYYSKEKVFFYQCKTCMRLFLEKENIMEFFKLK